MNNPNCLAQFAGQIPQGSSWDTSTSQSQQPQALNSIGYCTFGYGQKKKPVKPPQSQQPTNSNNDNFEYGINQKGDTHPGNYIWSHEQEIEIEDGEPGYCYMENCRCVGFKGDVRFACTNSYCGHTYRSRKINPVDYTKHG